MASRKDHWENEWKLNRDTKGIFQGVKDLEFELVPNNSGTKLKVYDFIYRPESATDDPFRNIQFVEFGDTLPNAPGSKLVPWKADLDIESDYQSLIDDSFNSAPANYLRLMGEKVVKGKKETIILRLIPDAIDTATGTSPIVDLIHVVCITHTRSAAPFFQDGTAHGNPR